jgi:uncharacterized membrane-anchored protein YitT (DUF2179 family)
MPAKAKKPQALFLSWPRLLADLLLINTGCILCAISINGILVPRHFVTGGITGVALLIHNQIPALNLGLIYVLINIPLFAMAWMAVGRRFFIYSILGALSLSLAVAFIHFEIPLDDRLLSALLAGLIMGSGTGMALRSSGSQGGIDILSVMLLKRFSISIGNTVLVTSIIILLLVGISYSLEALLYTLVVIFVSSKMVGVVVTGLSQRKAVFIISPESQQIANNILKSIRRGVTVLEGQGGYSGRPEKILYTVVSLTELGDLKRLITDIDPDAFVVISDTMEVINYRIGNQPHW